MAAMSISRTRLNLAIAWLLFWALMTATAIQEYQRNQGTQLWQPIAWEATSFITVTLLLTLQRHCTRRYDALVGSPVRWFARQLVWLPVYWVAFTPLAFAMRHVLYGLAGATYTHEAWPEVLLYENVKMTVFFFIFATITFGILSYHAMLAEKLRLERVDASLREMQLLRLTQQLQPHFLFNALNTVSSLMHTDVARADAMLVQLADVLRATLDVGERHQVPLATELRLLRGYAALMAERFVDRVTITWHVDETLLACPVPVMSMQPLLENIFKHTVERRRLPTAITIAVQREHTPGGPLLVLRLEDDAGRLDGYGGELGRLDGRGGSGGSAVSCRGGGSIGAAAGAGAGAGSGIGVRNLRARLAASYGDSATLELRQLAPAGVRAELRLPCAS